MISFYLLVVAPYFRDAFLADWIAPAMWTVQPPRLSSQVSQLQAKERYSHASKLITQNIRLTSLW